MGHVYFTTTEPRTACLYLSACTRALASSPKLSQAKMVCEGTFRAHALSFPFFLTFAT